MRTIPTRVAVGAVPAVAGDKLDAPKGETIGVIDGDGDGVATRLAGVG